ncbi:NAD(P)H-binding protein [Plantibacter sp. VKM Ac-2876]|uniref:NAD(P)H-binding protein n=1 Tax=Plantibacter sp. VKM Ac-2876 TaxID=2783826 RepID=UPI00188B3985|nr:NAD(P)H-binding protein [Plantibacter sp. VKM Ac-2876]MBF4564447.1 NAD(P)H-binding protein [Plantibacter sp. VKM Ac-2876]
MTSRDTIAATEGSTEEASIASSTRVFIFGITGRVGRLLAARLRARGVIVSGLTRSSLPDPTLEAEGVTSVTGELRIATTEEISAMISDWDVIVFAAGSNAGAQTVTDDIDDAALRRVSDSVAAMPGKRLILLSVLPEAWRERQLSDDEEHYFAVKKRAEVALTRLPIDWVILRPSLLTDDPGRGTVALGPAELHDEITRDDVAAVLEALVFEPAISRRILEVNVGPTAITEAVGRVARAYQA